MRCGFCEEEKTFNLKVEGDVGADAIWCDECYCNFDIYDIPISKDLKAQLTKWMQQYGDWIDWSKDVLCSNGVQMEDEHNKMGELLTVEVRKELGEEYKVRFSPSSSARMYARHDS
ncbi:hypothetical protein [Sporosarcina ureae]|uniref:hypothetical protein n=1 Tax=Sporosarcina ureae TaxID=1571 RepID=UPI0009DC7968|nr:hypothetical protein [Sporosarcina ureae]ARF17831.1 hypothetical protein SporoP17a_11450 [Sporosarcina ureae]